MEWDIFVCLATYGNLYGQLNPYGNKLCTPIESLNSVSYKLAFFFGYMATYDNLYGHILYFNYLGYRHMHFFTYLFDMASL